MINKIDSQIIARNSVFMAAYIALCIIFQPISYGEVQVRIAEALCILPIFDKYSVYSITLACMISNLIGGGNLVDIIFGSLATFVGLFAIRFIKSNNFFLKMLPTIISNAIIIPFVLRYGYGLTNMPIYLSAMWIALGEIISIYIIGYIFYQAIMKTNIYNKLK